MTRPHRAPVAQNGILGPENPKSVTSRSVTWRCFKSKPEVFQTRVFPWTSVWDARANMLDFFQDFEGLTEGFLARCLQGHIIPYLNSVLTLYRCDPSIPPEEFLGPSGPKLETKLKMSSRGLQALGVEKLKSELTRVNKKGGNFNSFSFIFLFFDSDFNCFGPWGRKAPETQLDQLRFQLWGGGGGKTGSS